MSERSTIGAFVSRCFRRKQRLPFTTFEEAHRREVAENMAVLDANRRRLRQEERAREIAVLWPVGAGLLVAAVAPQLQDLAAGIGPWAVMLLFPFAVLAERPEIQVGHITGLLPQIMLYAQFPLEGLLARIILRRGIRPLAVAGQVMLFHLLGIMELWMLSPEARKLLL